MFNPRQPGPNYSLRWPRELFTREARELLRRRPLDAQWRDEVECLLERGERA